MLFTPEQLPSLTSEQVSLLLASNAWSAAVIRQDPLWIVYHSQHAPARRESDLMHELAHVLLKHLLVGFDPTTGLPQRRLQDEDEATYLGGCLQIPRRGLLWAVERKMTLAEMCAHFGASKKMVQFRGNVTGVLISNV
jgi:Zn-dependent peptidase ImmA (M78 family)